jgi:hypothetical protein
VRVAWVSARRATDALPAFEEELAGQLRRHADAATTDPIALLDAAAWWALRTRRWSWPSTTRSSCRTSRSSADWSMSSPVTSTCTWCCAVAAAIRSSTLALGTVDTVLVPARDLLLSVSEIGQLAMALGVQLSTAQAEELFAAFGGWPSATRLVLEDVDPTATALPMCRAIEYPHRLASCVHR